MKVENPLIDISLPVTPGMPVYPGDPAVDVGTVMSFHDGPSHVSRVAMLSHTGTHVDAPAHFVRGGQTLAEVPLSRFVGPAWVVELPEAPAITADHLMAVWPGGEVERLLMKTPNSNLWGTPSAGLMWQALSADAAEWLVAMGVRLIGIDALSIEKDTDGTFPVHHTLLGAEVVILEGINLHAVAPGAYDLLCLPLRLDVPDGAPARALLRAR